MDADDSQTFRQLFEDYLRMYTSRDDALTGHFSEDFSGFTGGGDFLVKDRAQWVAITRQDFAQVKEPIRVELKDLAIQALADSIVVTTGFFTIHLPIPDHILSRETARLVLVFRKESSGWKISHSSISIPYYLVRQGEVYPMSQLAERNQALEDVIADRTAQLSHANDALRKTNERLAQEVADHKQAGDALQVSNNRIKAITHVLPDGIGMLTLDGRLLHVSEVLVRMHGYAVGEQGAFMGRPVLEFIHPSSHGVLLDNVRKVLAGAGSQNATEYLALRKDGSTFNIDVKSTLLHDPAGAPSGILYVERDITERKAAERSLEASLSLLAASLESTADGILIVDRDGRLSRWNRKFVDMWGIPEDLLDTHDDERVIAHILAQLSAPEEFLARVRALYDQPEESSFDRIPFLDGRVFERYSQPQRTRDGVVGRVWSFRDITPRLRAEADREKLEAQNSQLQKAESLGRMAGAIAHHFNNQLAVVIGNLQMTLADLQRGVVPDGGVTGALAEAMTAARMAAEMSGRMLTYLGQTTGKREPLDVSKACLQSLPILRSVVPARVALESDLGAAGVIINANASQLQQVLTQLVTNAWEAASENGGSIRLKVSTVGLMDVSAVRRYPIDWQAHHRSYARLEVSDSGCGIAERDIEKLFDPFFSSKFAGRGMGLAVVMGIVRAHDGVITVESTPGRGSCFRVFFPIHEGAAPQREEGLAPAHPAARGGAILFVEDEAPLRRTVSAMLKRLGYAVLEAADGVEAMEVFALRQADIVCVICDLTMPRMDGWETLSALSQRAPGLPVILASGHDRLQVMAGGHPEMPRAFLAKPFSLEQLRQAIERAVSATA